MSKISITKNKVQFLQSTCGECPKIKTICDDDNIEELIERRKSFSMQIEELNITLKTVQDQQDKLDEYVRMESVLNSQIANDLKTITNLSNQIVHWKVQVIEIDYSKIEQYHSQEESLRSRYNSIYNEKKHFLFARNMLSDEAIRAFIVKKYLPSINKLLNANIQRFVGNIVMDFDEEFEPVFKARHKEKYSYESHSEGQKKLINIAILFMFIDFCKMKYQYASTNLLILDEVTTGLDVELQDKFYETIKKIAISEKKCIVVIQHGDIASEHVDHNYKIELVSGFSKLTKM
jgi:DNA repair exonuclease SbcCD ATPase subunit